MPWAIEYVSGIVIRIKNAGMAAARSSKLIRAICDIIRKPTSTSAGAVAAPGTTPAQGAATMEIKNSTPTNTECNPVRAPSATPAADSM